VKIDDIVIGKEYAYAASGGMAHNYPYAWRVRVQAIVEVAGPERYVRSKAGLVPIKVREIHVEVTGLPPLTNLRYKVGQTMTVEAKRLLFEWIEMQRLLDVESRRERAVKEHCQRAETALKALGLTEARYMRCQSTAEDTEVPLTLPELEDLALRFKQILADWA
jgi:hypothetical protein